jgi:hypothetical protein
MGRRGLPSVHRRRDHPLTLEVDMSHCFPTIFLPMDRGHAEEVDTLLIRHVAGIAAALRGR